MYYFFKVQKGFIFLKDKVTDYFPSYFHLKSPEQYKKNLCLPHEKAKRTSTNKVMNLRMSMTILLSDTCSGPKYGLTENI